MSFGISASTALAAALAASAVVGAEITVEPIGEVILASEPTGDGPVVGGLSGLAWDPGCDLYWAVVDDRGLLAPPRLHQLRIDLADGRLDDGDVEVVDTLILRGRDFDPLTAEGPDLEAITFDSDGALLLSSEGAGGAGARAWVRRFERNGDLLDELPLPEHLVPRAGRRRGVRNNLAFEGVSLAPDGRTLVLATENALLQDGPEADVDVPSPSRIVVYDVVERRVIAEHVWMVEPVPDPPVPADGFRMNGISELVALDRSRILVLERSFSLGVGNTVRIFLGDLGGASDVSGATSISESSPGGVRPVEKMLVADIEQLGLDPDNLEGMAFGPRLPDGRRALLLLSDNNFNPFGQLNQVIALAVGDLDPPFDPAPPRVSTAELQGATQVSPFVGRCVTGVGGVITGVDPGRRETWAWLQAPFGDRDPATSEAVRLRLPPGPVAVGVGDAVEVSGRVTDTAGGQDLPVTTLEVRSLERLATQRPLPAPVRIGPGGRQVPEVVHDGGPGFEPAARALDLYESLEGMRVEIGPAVVTGPTSRYGDLWVVPEPIPPDVPRTRSGGVRLDETGDLPQRVALDDPLTSRPPPAAVGDRTTGPVVGILHWAFGGWRVLVTGGWPPLEAGGVMPERAALGGPATDVTIATVNLENLSAASDPARFVAFGELIAGALDGPAVVALQEVQDDSGRTDDQTVTAAGTLDLLTTAIAAAGGPAYVWAQIDPVDGADGGQPGGNIRVAVLVDPARVELVRRGSAGPDDAVVVVAGPSLSLSPGRIAPGDPAWTDGRKPLAVELRVGGAPLFLVDLHLASKLGDDPQMGRRQPPQRATEERRVAQARVVRSFVDAILAVDPEAAVVVLGDLNDHEFRPPVEELTAGGLVDLIRRVPARDRFTFVFQGRSQVLDHVLVSPTLVAGAEVDVVHLNAEFPAAARASDHDPVVVGLRMPSAPGR